VPDVAKASVVKSNEQGWKIGLKTLRLLGFFKNLKHPSLGFQTFCEMFNTDQYRSYLIA